MFKFKPIKIDEFKFKDVAYHRNGVGGEGFYCAIIENEKTTFLATYFPMAPGINCAIYDVNLLPNIKDNTWRGDYFVNAMVRAVEEYRKQNKTYITRAIQEKEQS